VALTRYFGCPYVFGDTAPGSNGANSYWVSNTPYPQRDNAFLLGSVAWDGDREAFTDDTDLPRLTDGFTGKSGSTSGDSGLRGDGTLTISTVDIVDGSPVTTTPAAKTADTIIFWGTWENFAQSLMLTVDGDNKGTFSPVDELGVAWSNTGSGLAPELDYLREYFGDERLDAGECREIRFDLGESFSGTVWQLTITTAGIYGGPRYVEVQAFQLNPKPFVLADWDGDGFGGYGSDDDLTSDVESWRITRGASAEITGGAQPGSATVILNNPADDRYNPLNAAGPLYGKLRDGVPFWISVNPDGSVTGTEQRGLFGGRIKDITPIPSDGGGRALKVEILCEDALGWLGRTPVTLADALFRSQGAIRAAILTAAGETRTVLAHETATVPLSSWDGSALGALEELNKANGTRHLIRPGDTPTAWYDYVARDRQWRLDGTVDASVDAGAEHVTGTDGWRLSADTVTNQQRATVTPITFTRGQVTAWEAEALPFTFSGTRTLWPTFDDYLDAPVVDINYTGSAVSATLTSFGATAKLVLTSAATSTVTGLSIEGRLARRGTAESHVADDLTSQAGLRGIRAGSDISGDWVGVLATARGMAEHVVWRYGDTQYRPSLTIQNWFPEMFEVDLYDVLAATIAQLAMTARRFEIVGWTMEGRIAASSTVCHHILTLVLQECRVQADPGWFILDTSVLDGSDILAY
jgi:hypothetical protein